MFPLKSAWVVPGGPTVQDNPILVVVIDQERAGYCDTFVRRLAKLGKAGFGPKNSSWENISKVNLTYCWKISVLLIRYLVHHLPWKKFNSLKSFNKIHQNANCEYCFYSQSIVRTNWFLSGCVSISRISLCVRTWGSPSTNWPQIFQGLESTSLFVGGPYLYSPCTLYSRMENGFSEASLACLANHGFQK